MKYRKKPVVIEAVEWTGCNLHNLIDWVGEHNLDLTKPNLTIKTLEGDHLTMVGDYIIKGINGEFYPCKPDIFEKTYEKVGEDIEIS